MAEMRFDKPSIVGEDAKVVTFTNGGIVFLKGDEGELAYVVRAGKVEIREGGRALEALSEGGLFGEMALIDGAPRNASAVAIGHTELIAIDRPTFDGIIRHDPDFAVGVMRLMARRLRATVAATSSPGDQLAIDSEARQSA